MFAVLVSLSVSLGSLELKLFYLFSNSIVTEGGTGVGTHTVTPSLLQGSEELTSDPQVCTAVFFYHEPLLQHRFLRLGRVTEKPTGAIICQQEGHGLIRYWTSKQTGKPWSLMSMLSPWVQQLRRCSESRLELCFVLLNQRLFWEKYSLNLLSVFPAPCSIWPFYFFSVVTESPEHLSRTPFHCSFCGFQEWNSCFLLFTAASN